MSGETPARIDVFSDVVCPWCYIGRARLSAALERLGPGLPRPAIRWRAYELQPDLPPEGVEARPFYARKFGGEARVEQMFAHVAQVAAGDGLKLDFDRQRRAPNTRLAHRVMALCERQVAGTGDAVALAFFRAHFTLGLDVSRAEVLLEAAGEAAPGLDLDALRAALATGAALDEVLAEERLAASLGIRGVPFYVAGLDGDRPTGLSGAQPVPIFERFVAELSAH